MGVKKGPSEALFGFQGAPQGHQSSPRDTLAGRRGNQRQTTDQPTKRQTRNQATKRPTTDRCGNETVISRFRTSSDIHKSHTHSTQPQHKHRQTTNRPTNRPPYGPTNYKEARRNARSALNNKKGYLNKEITWSENI